MKYEEIRHAWNAQADEHNQWDELGEDEKIEWAARVAAVKERTARQAAQAEVADLKGRISRAGVEHRTALRKAVQEEREACAQVLDAMAAEAEADLDPSFVVAYYRDLAAAIRARTT